MTTLKSDLVTASEWIAGALQSSAYRADFTPASLWAVERFLDEQTANGRPRAKGLLSVDLGARLFAIGAYVGEVIRRDIGGNWSVDDADPEGEINVSLILSGGKRIWPVQRIISRVQEGDSCNIAVYAAILGVSVGAGPVSSDWRG